MKFPRTIDKPRPFDRTLFWPHTRTHTTVSYNSSKEFLKKFLLNFNYSIIFLLKQVKSLGVTLDQTLFSSHMRMSSSRATYVLMRINRVERLYNESKRQIALNSLVLSNYNLYQQNLFNFFKPLKKLQSFWEKNKKTQRQI